MNSKYKPPFLRSAMKQRKKGEFNPTSAQIANATNEFLKNQGRITRLEPGVARGFRAIDSREISLFCEDHGGYYD